MNFAANWNRLDSFIYFCESKIRDIIADKKEDEPDVEIMIQAATEHLRKANEDLKRREVPAYLIEEGGRYICPKCRIEITDTIKYCPNCGHRVMKKIESAN